MTTTIVKSLATVATLVALAAMGNVQTAQANQGADDPVAHATTPATGAIAPNAATPATKNAHKVTYRHPARDRGNAVRRADDTPKPRQTRRADHSRLHGTGADDAPSHR